MNAFDYVVAVILIQPLIVGFGLVGYWLRPRYPRAGLILGIVAVVMVAAGLLVSLWQYAVAAIAGAAVGVGAITRPSRPEIARWLAIGGTVAWFIAIALLFVDAGT